MEKEPSRPRIGFVEDVDSPETDTRLLGEGKNVRFLPQKHSVVSQKSMGFDGSGLDLYDEEAEESNETASAAFPKLSAYLRGFVMPGSQEREEADRRSKKAKLGMILGVYLPTIQHIFGVIMFLRVFWIVGTAGVVESFSMVFMCCLCTFLTSISMSAIATNGVVESGGSYFMISRNLGPEFGSAVGIVFYLANACATAFYLVGTVEILLTYIAPQLPQFTEGSQAMFNNFRVYASGLLLLVFCAVALGVRFVQMFAPVSLACVLISILAVFAGAFSAQPSNSPHICMVGDKLLKGSIWMGNGTGNLGCTKNSTGPLYSHYCHTSPNGSEHCDPYFLENSVRLVDAMPGFASGVIFDNAWPSYMSEGDSTAGLKGDHHSEVVQDLTTTFFVLLAIYFPSVTGIMTGSNMSGDLKDPQKAIPVGTLAAQLTTSFVYLSFVLLFGGTIRKPLLLDKFGESLGSEMVVAVLAWPHKWVLLIGSFTSTFGAGLQCLCSAPRLIQSIAKDDVLPFLRPLSVLTKNNEPFRALVVTAIISECTILIGAVDHIAPVVDFFFLTCYAFVNIVCAFQTLMKAPNWRPRFKYYHWTLSLLGAFICFFIMFSTFWYYAIVVLLLCLAIYKYVEYKGAKKEWGDGMRGLALSTAQYSLLKIEDSQSPHPKNWRPQLLVLASLTDDLKPRYNQLLLLANHLKAGKGLTIVTSLLTGDLANSDDREKAETAQSNMKSAMKENKVKGFANTLLCSDLADSIDILIQSTGIGGLRPNTVMVGWPAGWKESAADLTNPYWTFIDKLHRVTAAGHMCLLVPKGISMFPSNDQRLKGTIDVWWIIQDGGLLILLPFLLKQHKVWRHCKLRVFAVAQLEDNSVKMRTDLQKWFYQLRIDASVEIVEMSERHISAYAYERTLMMEEREKLAKSLTAAEISHEPQLIVDNVRKISMAQRRSSPPPTISVNGGRPSGEVEFDLDNREDQSNENTVDSNMLSPNDGTSERPLTPNSINQFTFSPAQLKAAEEGKSASPRAERHVDRKKMKKMHSAVKLNKIIVEKSGAAQLVVLNLPKPPSNRLAFLNYIEYLDVLTEGLDRVLLVRGSGREVITIYS